ncbi:O-antigen ligase family protein [Lactobacillus johnsonii]|uniref:Oligosaccharide repeat unit polymerase n=1 Tax=Lactobacillus johnsonii (strain FI9785) TaxID=633699 RepID=D0R4M1_LACJF|nr:O-antigen ligase family protein [Lactobacillus johnsonii]CAX67034.1 oligosaccharide repeat unit polymerase [Lactobacillus johnsonii FI9785]
MGYERAKVVDFIKNKYLYKFVTFILSFLLILNTNSIWTTIPGTKEKFINILYLVLPVCIFFSLLSVKIDSIKFRNILVLTIFFLIYFSIFLIVPVNRGSISLGLKLLVSFISFLLYFGLCTDTKKFPLIFEYYINWMVIIGIVSLVLWMLVSCMRILQFNSSILSDWSTFNGYAARISSYHGIYFETQYLNNIPRNSAIFPEAPMASLHFLVALSLNFLFCQGKFSKAKNLLLILAIISTLSSTGYIGIVLLFTYKMVFYKFKNNTLNYLKFLWIVVFLIGSIVIVNLIFSQKIGSESGNIRKDDYLAAFNAWKTSPIFGVGLVSDTVKNYMSLWRSYNLGFSNSLMDVLAHGGLWSLVVYVGAGLKGIISNLKIKNFNMIMFVVMTFYLFATTIFTNSFLILAVFIWIATSKPTEEKI